MLRVGADDVEMQAVDRCKAISCLRQCVCVFYERLRPAITGGYAGRNSMYITTR
jgi:hypothetical protein